MDLDALNSLPAAAAEAKLLKCCGCARWAHEVATRRPFTDETELKRSANEVWWYLSQEDWLEAFRSHPKIGEKKAAATTSTQSQRWSEDEQSRASQTAVTTATALAVLNQQYEDKFGHIFIVCATGKTADEMLDDLRARLDNAPDDELRIAAQEQAKITELRLAKLLGND